MKAQITVKDQEYYDAQYIIVDPNASKEEIKAARVIVANADYLRCCERNDFIASDYPNAPEGSIWDY